MKTVYKSPGNHLTKLRGFGKIQPLTKLSVILAACVLVFALTACPTDDLGGGDESFTITSTAQWNDAISKIKSGGNGRSYELIIVGTVPVPPSNSDLISGRTFGSAENLTVTLKGNGTLFSLSAVNGRIFYLYGSSASKRQKLVIDGPTLQGTTTNYDPVVEVTSNAILEMKNGKITGNIGFTGGVSVNGGDFTMSGGEISGNTSVTNQAGGVSIVNGSFTMTGGEISGNTADLGSGGVLVNGDGEVDATFTMSGGKISGNIASNYGGGGVWVYGNYGNGSFTMTGGVISGNTASKGGGVYVESGSFIKSGSGTIYGDTNSIHTPGTDENTATDGNTTYGHAVYYKTDTDQYYRDTTLGTGANISTATLPPTANSNWIKK